jgi:hypothetical protein
MPQNDYAELVKIGKKNNPKLFNDPIKLRAELEGMDEIIEKTTDVVANMINVQMRNILAFALGEELLDEKPYSEAVRRKYQ